MIYGLASRLYRWVNRHPRLSTGLCAAGVGLLGAAGCAVYDGDAASASSSITSMLQPIDQLDLDGCTSELKLEHYEDHGTKRSLQLNRNGASLRLEQVPNEDAAAVRIPIDTEGYKGRADVFGSRGRKNGNWGAGINVTGKTPEGVILGADLEAAKGGNHLARLYGGKEWDDFTAVLGVSDSRKAGKSRRQLDGIAFQKLDDKHLVGAGFTRSNRGETFGHLVASRYTKKPGEGIGWRACLTSGLKGSYRAGLIVSNKTTIGALASTDPFGMTGDVHEGGLRAATNAFDDEVPKLNQRTRRGWAVGADYSRNKHGKDDFMVSGVVYPRPFARDLGWVESKNLLDNVWVGAGRGRVGGRSRTDVEAGIDLLGGKVRVYGGRVGNETYGAVGINVLEVLRWVTGSPKKSK